AVAEGGRMLVDIPACHATALEGSMKLPLREPDDFRVASKGAKVRLATIDRPRFTQWGETEAAVKDGFVIPPEGATMISVTHRHGMAGPITRTGFLTGWGNWNGAFATTVSHDSHNLTVFGGNAEDMALAANAVIKAGGGMAVASEGKVTALLSLPLSGLVSDAPLEYVAMAFE
ncbi:MAG: adenine deaminase C-terminal domain-containing protein, partial [Agrobacterium sp.]